MNKFKLNGEQQQALEGMITWLEMPNAEPFYVLQGHAGTGKTYTCQALANHIKGRVVYTAPTNKATKVLRQTLTTPEYRPDCRTIYSLLGLRLEASGEVKELSKPEEDIDLTSYRLVVVDEASMINKQVLGCIEEAAEQYNLKFLFLGDPAQLPPVGEPQSPIWAAAGRATTLQTVMRHDNQILTLATQIRKLVDHPAPSIKFKDDNDEKGGVWAHSQGTFRRLIRDDALVGRFSVPDRSKVIAWRNVTVDSYNQLIRERIFPNATQPWVAGDRVIFTAPAKDLDDEPVASTDDEGTVMSAAEASHPIFVEFKVWRLSITLDDSRVVIAQVLHPASFAAFGWKKDELAQEARSEGFRWKQYWKFIEAFHQIRYAYAITAHRSQGSTYETVYVDYRDILLNRNRQEAVRCLYVACTRPKVDLHLA